MGRLAGSADNGPFFALAKPLNDDLAALVSGNAGAEPVKTQNPIADGANRLKGDWR